MPWRFILMLCCAGLACKQGSKRRREDGYECGIKCDSIAEFLHMLPGGWVGGLGSRWCVYELMHSAQACGPANRQRRTRMVHYPTLEPAWFRTRLTELAHTISVW
jgi:hypothetical protein